MQIHLHVSEINAAIALFSGVAEKIREQAIAQSQAQEQAEREAQAQAAKDAQDRLAGIVDAPQAPEGPGLTD